MVLFQANRADIVTLDAGDVYSAVKQFGLVLVAREVYSEGSFTMWCEDNRAATNGHFGHRFFHQRIDCNRFLYDLFLWIGVARVSNEALAWLALHALLPETHANTSCFLELNLVPTDGLRKTTVPNDVFYFILFYFFTTF